MKGSASKEGVNMAAISAPFQITLDMGHKLLSSMEQKAKAALKVKTAEKKAASNTGNKQEQNRISDEELMKSIPNEYYQEGFDAVQDTLAKLPADVDTKYVDKLLVDRERVLDVVNSKLFGRVMSSYSAFVQGMTQIHELGLDLQQSTIMCKNGRRNITAVSEELTTGGLVIMYNYRRRQILVQMMNDLLGIKSISTLRQQLTLMMNQGDYTKAIQVCLQALTTAKQCGHFSVVRELDFLLQDTYSVVQERLDKALFENCRNFNPSSYERVLQAYKLLGTTAKINEKLQPYFVDPIESETKNILLAHALLSPQNMPRAEQLKNYKFKELCSVLREEHYVNCLLIVLENLCDVMSSHYAMAKWHQDHSTDENNKWYTDIQAGLKRVKTTIWDSMQRKVSDLMSSVQLGSFKVDDFLKIVEGVTLFLDVGNDFSGITAPNLRNTLTVQSKAFLENFHKQRVDDLRTMLENEMWTRCPVTPNFSVADVNDFRAPLTAPLFSTGLLGADKRFTGIRANGNPFSKMIQYAKKFAATTTQKVEQVEEDDEPSALLVDHVDEDPDSLSPPSTPRIGGVPTSLAFRGGPLLASITINTVRMLGKYMNMLRVLHQHLAFEIFVAITHVYEYYLYSVYAFFGVAPPMVNMEEISQTLGIRLRKTLTKLKEKYNPITPSTLLQMPDAQLLQKIGNSTTSAVTSFASTVTSTMTAAVTLPSDRDRDRDRERDREHRETRERSSSTSSVVDDMFKVKWLPAKLTPTIASEITNAKVGYGLGTRSVGIESLSFMQEALTEAKPLLISLLPPAGVELLGTFYNNEVSTIPELRTYLYKIVISAFLNTETIATNIANTKWDVTVVPVNSTPYVDNLLRELTQFGQRVDRSVQLPSKVKMAVWEAGIARAVDQLVEGYSRIKKCTMEGRAILLQDLKAIQNGIAQIAPLKGTKAPAISYAENYITAYYLPIDQDLIDWFKSHSEYSLRHVLALVNVNPSANINRTKKGQVIQALEDIDKARKGQRV